MAKILCIDTSTDIGSVAFSVDGNVIINRVCYEDRSHAIKSGVFVDEVLSEAQNSGIQPEAIAVCSGPGSYTGLRIGVSLAKGLCYGYDIPLIAIDTLKVMANGVLNLQSIEPSAILVPMIDARRMEVYHASFDAQLKRLSATRAEVMEATSFDALSDKSLYLFGNGSDKCKNILRHPKIHYFDEIAPLASDLAPLAEEAFNRNNFEDVAYFEPFYLKNFIATISKKNVLGR